MVSCYSMSLSCYVMLYILDVLYGYVILCRVMVCYVYDVLYGIMLYYVVSCHVMLYI
jgi:hypothetical protein